MALSGKWNQIGPFQSGVFVATWRTKTKCRARLLTVILGGEIDQNPVLYIPEVLYTTRPMNPSP